MKFPSHYQARIHPSRIEGSAAAPPSKSYTQRALVASLLADGKSKLTHPGESEDERHMLETIRQLGAIADPTNEGWVIQGGLKNAADARELHMGESGLGIRLITPVAAMLQGTTTLIGGGSLRKRPMSPFEQALREAGGQCWTQQGYLPLKVQGPLQGGTVHLDGSHGSQFLSGLLFALPLAKKDSRIVVDNLRSKPYIDMTLEVLEHYGIQVHHHQYQTFYIPGNQRYHPAHIEIEGDWSNAALLLTGAAIHGEVTLKGLQAQSAQGDRKILEALSDCGVGWTHNQGTFTLQSPKELSAFDFDATHCPDLFPPLAVLAAYARGTSSIFGVHRLKHKESNRARALEQLLSANGIEATRGNHDEMIITGGQPTGGTIDSQNDHRIAMAAAILALKARNPILVQRAQAIRKSFPAFFEILQKLHVKIEYPS